MNKNYTSKAIIYNTCHEAHFGDHLHNIANHDQCQRGADHYDHILIIKMAKHTHHFVSSPLVASLR